MIKNIIRKESEYEITYWKKNYFERVDGGALIRVGKQSNAKRENKIYIINKKGEWKRWNGVREVFILLGLSRNLKKIK